MAEAYLNKYGGNKFIVKSAGIEPGELNPIVVKALLEDGIDISVAKTQSVFEVLKMESVFDYLITVCDEASAQRCPYVPGVGKRLHWSFKDPSGFKGSFSERLLQTIQVRDEIKQKIKKFIKED